MTKTPDGTETFKQVADDLLNQEIVLKVLE